MDETGKDPNLPVQLEACNSEPLSVVSVVTVNESSIEPLGVPLSQIEQTDDCSTARGLVDLKVLGKHFVKGINRFELQAGDVKAEIVLDVEL